MDWLYDLKLLAVDVTGLEKDALHIYVGVIVLIAAAWLFRWGLASFKGLLLVLAVALVNEFFDVRHNLEIEKQPFLLSSVHDIVNTMLLPTALVILARWTSLFAKPETGSGDEA